MSEYSFDALFPAETPYNTVVPTAHAQAEQPTPVKKSWGDMTFNELASSQEWNDLVNNGESTQSVDALKKWRTGAFSRIDVKNMTAEEVDKRFSDIEALYAVGSTKAHGIKYSADMTDGQRADALTEALKKNQEVDRLREFKEVDGWQEAGEQMAVGREYYNAFQQALPLVDENYTALSGSSYLSSRGAESYDGYRKLLFDEMALNGSLMGVAGGEEFIKEYKGIMKERLGAGYSDEQAEDFLQSMAKQEAKVYSGNREVGDTKVEGGILDFDGINDLEGLRAVKDRKSMITFLQENYGDDLTNEEIYNTTKYLPYLKDMLVQDITQKSLAVGEDVFVGENDFDEFSREFRQANEGASDYDVVLAFAETFNEGGFGQWMEQNVGNRLGRGLQNFYNGFVTGGQAIAYSAFKELSQEDTEGFAGTLKQFVMTPISVVGGDGAKRSVMNGFGALSDTTKQLIQEAAKDQVINAQKAALRSAFMRDVADYGTAEDIMGLVSEGVGYAAPTLIGAALTGGGSVAAKEGAKGVGKAITSNILKGAANNFSAGMMFGAAYGNGVPAWYNRHVENGLSPDEALSEALVNALPAAAAEAVITRVFGGIDGKGLIDLEGAAFRRGASAQSLKAAGVEGRSFDNAIDVLKNTSLRDVISVYGGEKKLAKAFAGAMDEDLVKLAKSVGGGIAGNMGKGFGAVSAKNLASDKIGKFFMTSAAEAIEEGLAGGVQGFSDAFQENLIGYDDSSPFQAFVEGMLLEAFVGAAAGKVLGGVAGGAREVGRTSFARERVQRLNEYAAQFDTRQGQADILNDLASSAREAGNKEAADRFAKQATVARSEAVSQSSPESIKEAAKDAPAGFSEPIQGVGITLTPDGDIDLSGVGRPDIAGGAAIIDDPTSEGVHPLFGRGDYPNKQLAANTTRVKRGMSAQEASNALQNHVVIGEVVSPSGGKTQRVLARISTNTSPTSTDAFNSDRVLNIAYNANGDVTSVSAPQELTTGDLRVIANPSGANINPESLFRSENAKEDTGPLTQRQAEFQQEKAENTNPVNVDFLEGPAKRIGRDVNGAFRSALPENRSVVTEDRLNVGIDSLKTMKDRAKKFSGDTKKNLVDGIDNAITRLEAAKSELPTESTDTGDVVSTGQEAVDVTETGVEASEDTATPPTSETSSDDGGVINDVLSSDELDILASEAFGDVERGEEINAEGEVQATMIPSDGERQNLSVDKALGVGEEVPNTNQVVIATQVDAEGKHNYLTLGKNRLANSAAPATRKLITRLKRKDGAEDVSKTIQEYVDHLLGKDKGYNTNVRVTVSNGLNHYGPTHYNQHTNTIHVDATPLVGFADMESSTQAYLQSYITKAINEELIHLATVESFIADLSVQELAQDGGLDQAAARGLALQKVAEIGAEVRNSNPRMKFLRESYKDNLDGVDDAVIGFEWLNAVAQRATTGFSTGDISRIAPENFAKDLFNRVLKYVRAFKNAIMARSIMSNDPDLRDRIVKINETIATWSPESFISDTRLSVEIDNALSKMEMSKASPLSRAAFLQLRANDLKKSMSPVVEVKDLKSASEAVQIPEVVEAMDSLVRLAGSVRNSTTNKKSIININNGVVSSNVNPALLPQTKYDAAAYRYKDGMKHNTTPAQYEVENAIEILNVYNVAEAFRLLQPDVDVIVSSERSQLVKDLNAALNITVSPLASALVDSRPEAFAQLVESINTSEDRQIANGARNLLSQLESGAINAFNGMDGVQRTRAEFLLRYPNIEAIVASRYRERNSGVSASRIKMDTKTFKDNLYTAVREAIATEEDVDALDMLNTFTRDALPQIETYYNVRGLGLPVSVTSAITEFVENLDGVDPELASVERPLIDLTGEATEAALEAATNNRRLTREATEENQRIASAFRREELASLIKDRTLGAPQYEFVAQYRTLLRPDTLSTEDRIAIKESRRPILEVGDRVYDFDTVHTVNDTLKLLSKISPKEMKDVDGRDVSKALMAGGKNAGVKMVDGYTWGTQKGVPQRSREDLRKFLNKPQVEPKLYLGTQAIGKGKDGEYVDNKKVKKGPLALAHQQWEDGTLVNADEQINSAIQIADSVVKFYEGHGDDGVVKLIKALNERKNTLNKAKNERDKLKAFIDLHRFADRFNPIFRGLQDGVFRGLNASEWTATGNLIHEVTDTKEDVELTFQAEGPLRPDDKPLLAVVVNKFTGSVARQNVFNSSILTQYENIQEGKDIRGKEVEEDVTIDWKKDSLADLLDSFNIVPQKDFSAYLKAASAMSDFKKTGKILRDKFSGEEFDPAQAQHADADRGLLTQAGLTKLLSDQVQAIRTGAKNGYKGGANGAIVRTHLAMYLFDGDADAVRQFFTSDPELGSHEDMLEVMIDERLLAEAEGQSSLEAHIRNAGDAYAQQAMDLLIGKEVLGYDLMPDRSMVFRFGNDTKDMDVATQEELGEFALALGKSPNVTIASSADQFQSNLYDAVDLPVIYYNASDLVAPDAFQSTEDGSVLGRSVQALTGGVTDAQGNVVAYLINREDSVRKGDKDTDTASHDKVEQHIISTMAERGMANNDLLRAEVEAISNVLTDIYSNPDEYSSVTKMVGVSQVSEWWRNGKSLTEAAGISKLEIFKESYEKAFGGWIATPETFLKAAFTSPHVHKMLSLVDPAFLPTPSADGVESKLTSAELWLERYVPQWMTEVNITNAYDSDFDKHAKSEFDLIQELENGVLEEDILTPLDIDEFFDGEGDFNDFKDDDVVVEEGVVGGFQELGDDQQYTDMLVLSRLLAKAAQSADMAERAKLRRDDTIANEIVETRRERRKARDKNTLSVLDVAFSPSGSLNQKINLTSGHKEHKRLSQFIADEIEIMLSTGPHTEAQDLFENRYVQDGQTYLETKDLNAAYSFLSNLGYDVDAHLEQAQQEAEQNEDLDVEAEAARLFLEDEATLRKAEEDAKYRNRKAVTNVDVQWQTSGPQPVGWSLEEMQRSADTNKSLAKFRVALKRTTSPKKLEKLGWDAPEIFSASNSIPRATSISTRPTATPSLTVNTGEPITRALIPGFDKEFDKNAQIAQLKTRSALYSTNDRYADAVQAERDESPQFGGMKKQIDGMIAIISQIALLKNIDPTAVQSALYAMKAARNGDIAKLFQYGNYAIGYYTVAQFTDNVEKAINGKVVGDILANAPLAHADARFDMIFPRNAAAREFLDQMQSIMDFSLTEGTGRNGFYSKVDAATDVFEKHKKLSMEENMKATAALYMSNYSLNVNASGDVTKARDQINTTLDYYDRSIDYMEGLIADKRTPSLVRKRLKNQIPIIRETQAKVKDFLANSDVHVQGQLDSLTVDDVVDVMSSLVEHLQKDMKPSQKAFMDDSIMAFSDMENEVGLVAEMNGQNFGRIENYVPLISFKDAEDSMGLDSDPYSLTPAQGQYTRTRGLGEQAAYAVNLDGLSGFKSSMRAMMYNTNTRASFTLMSTLFGVEDPESHDGYKKSLYSDIITAGVASGKLSPNLHHGIQYFRNTVQNVLNNDRSARLSESRVDKAIGAASDLFYKQALTSLQQPIKQTIPIIASYAVRNFASPKANARLARAIGRGIKNTLVRGEGYKNFRELLKTYAPHVAKRAGDGIDFSNTKFYDALAGESTLSQTVASPAKLIDFVSGVQGVILDLVIGKPDALIIQSIIDAEYENKTGQSLQDVAKGEVNIPAFRAAVKVAEGTMAMSDKSKKGKWFQTHDTTIKNFGAKALLAFSNHVVSVGSTARAGTTMLFSGDADTRKQGLSNMLDIVIQNTIFNLLSVGSIAYFIGKSMGETEEDEEYYQQLALNTIANDIPFLEHRQGSAKTDEKFWWQTGLNTMVDSFAPVRGAGVLSSIAQTNGLIKDIGRSVVEKAGGPKLFDRDEYVLSDVYQVADLTGPTGGAVANAIDYISAYIGARQEYNLGHEDALYFLYQFLGFRESRGFMAERIKERNDTPVFDNQLKDDGETGGFFENIGFEGGMSIEDLDPIDEGFFQ